MLLGELRFQQLQILFELLETVDRAIRLGRGGAGRAALEDQRIVGQPAALLNRAHLTLTVDAQLRIEAVERREVELELLRQLADVAGVVRT